MARGRRRRSGQQEHGGAVFIVDRGAKRDGPRANRGTIGADVPRPAGIAKQILFVAGLRWRLLHNNLRRKQARLDLLGLIIVGSLASLVVVGLSFALFEGAYDFVSTGRVAWLSLFFWAIFLWWQLFPVMVAGFGGSFEFRNLLRFPLRLSAFYLIGLAYGLAAFSGAAGFVWLLFIIG